jgi:hypothetical protein
MQFPRGLAYRVWRSKDVFRDRVCVMALRADCAHDHVCRIWCGAEDLWWNIVVRCCRMSVSQVNLSSHCDGKFDRVFIA